MEQFEVVITTEQIKSTSEIFEYQGLIIEDTPTTQEVYIIAVMSWLNILRHDLHTYVLFLDLLSSVILIITEQKLKIQLMCVCCYIGKLYIYRS